jgi:hypothetical protein
MPNFNFASSLYITERAGFEPAVPKGHTGFRNRLDQPLRHLSKSLIYKALANKTN